MTIVEYAPIISADHRFGNYDRDHPSHCAIKIPFSLDVENKPLFDVYLNVIDGDRPFLLGLPSLNCMGATVNHKYFTIAFSLQGKYPRFRLTYDGDHLFLPFKFSNATIHFNPPAGCEQNCKYHTYRHPERANPTWRAKPPIHADRTT